MSIRSLTAAAIIAASSIAASTAHAQLINDSFTYQGTLNEGGSPANGMYDITFILYEAQVGGFQIPNGFVTVNNVEVVEGLFSTEVDFGVIGQIFDSNFTRWMELRVSESGVPGTTTLEPRQKITPTTLANYAFRSGFAETSGTTLQNAYEASNGQLIINNATGPLELRGMASERAVMEFYSSTGVRRVRLSDDQVRTGGALNLYGPEGNSFLRIERDFDPGGGGFMSLARNDAGIDGFVFDGNRFGFESPRMSINGTSDSIVFEPDASDDDSVQLPLRSINSGELFNEPGVAERLNSGSVTLTQDSTVNDVLSSVTIQAPSAGFVLVIASAELSIAHDAGISSSVNVGVSASSVAFSNSNTDLETRIPSTAATGTYDFTVTSHAIFSASEGSNTFYFLGDLNNAAPVSAGVLDQQLSAIFIPTAYGTAGLQSNALSGQNIPDDFTPISAPMNQFDILAEQNASLQADNARQQRELDEMRAQVELIKRELQSNNQPSD